MNQFVSPPLAPLMSNLIHLPPSITFDQAAASYIEHGGDNRYLPRIVEHFRGRSLASIFPFDIYQMAEKLYPRAINATRNRQALTPARSVLIHGYERGWCNLIRLRRLKQDPPKRKKPAAPAWLHAFARQCDRDGLFHVAAVVLFMSQTGARVSEAVELRWAQVDLSGRTALLLKTKTSVNSRRYLTDELVTRLRQLRGDAGDGDRVFRYACRHSVNERIKAVCLRAGITYKSSHACGRHSFATNAIDNGIDVKSTMQAGDWRSVEVFLGTYVHPRQNAGRIVADRFNAYQYDADL